MRDKRGWVTIIFVEFVAFGRHVREASNLPPIFEMSRFDFGALQGSSAWVVDEEESEYRALGNATRMNRGIGHVGVKPFHGQAWSFVKLT